MNTIRLKNNTINHIVTHTIVNTYSNNINHKVGGMMDITNNNIISPKESNNKSITIKSFIALANREAKSVIPLAKEHLTLLNSKNKIGDLLKECGYQYDDKAKRWNMVIDKGITDDVTFEEYVVLNNLTDKFKFRGLQVEQSPVAKVKSQFTDDEIKVIREIIQMYECGSAEVVADLEVKQQHKKTIEEEINSLGRNAVNVRKTFLIDAKIAEDFQSFCDKRSLKYSDVISVAIKNLIDNYEIKR